MKTFRFPMLHVALAGGWALAMTSGVQAGSTPPMAKETRTLHVPHVVSGTLHVTTRNGAVSVEASERDDVEIVASLTATTQARLKETQVVAERDADNTLLVRVDWADGAPKNKEGCSFRILLPRATGAVIRTSNGAITLVGLEGTADLDSSNGRIEVREHAGDVKADSSNGPIIVEKARGLVEAETSNGSVSITDPGGEVSARTSNGKIDIAEATQAVTAKTSNGSINIRLTEQGCGPVDAQSSNGSVTLAVGRGFAGELKLRTSNASIRVDDLAHVTMLSDSKHRKHLRVGSAETPSNLQTSNGTIHVRKR